MAPASVFIVANPVALFKHDLTSFSVATTQEEAMGTDLQKNHTALTAQDAPGRSLFDWVAETVLPTALKRVRAYFAGK